MVKIRKISKKEDDKKPSGVLSKGSLRFNSDQPHILKQLQSNILIIALCEMSKKFAFLKLISQYKKLGNVWPLNFTKDVRFRRPKTRFHYLKVS